MSGTETCPTCHGVGTIPKIERPAELFPVGSRVHWNCTWWMYPKGVDGVVVAHSAAGKRLKIKHEVNNDRGEPTGRFGISGYLTPAMLEREDAGPDDYCDDCRQYHKGKCQLAPPTGNQP